MFTLGCWTPTLAGGGHVSRRLSCLAQPLARPRGIPDAHTQGAVAPALGLRAACPLPPQLQSPARLAESTACILPRDSRTTEWCPAATPGPG